MTRKRPPQIRPRSLAALVVSLAAALHLPAHTQQDDPTERLTVDRAVALALEHHPSALAARESVRAASAAVGELSALRLPHLAFEASATRFQEPMIVAPLHALDITQAPDFDRTLLRGTASISYNLFDGGTRGARIRGARAEADAAEYSRESAETSLIALVTQTYLTALSLSDVLNAHNTRLSALESELARVQNHYAEGTAARVAVLRAEAAIAQAEAERVSTASALEVAEQHLARLTGLSPSETSASRLVPVGLRQTEQTIDRETLVAQAAEFNPDLLRARSRHESAISNKSAANALWLPKISLFGGYLGFGSGAGDFTAEWQGGAKISYPVFTGGSRTNTITRTDAMVELAHQEVRHAELAIRDGVDRGLNAVHESRARVSAVEDAVYHLEEVARIERLALDAGSGTQAEYLRSEAELLRARASLIEARNGEIMARIQLARTLGQLTTDWLDRELESTR